jgi:hypothetical protein
VAVIVEKGKHLAVSPHATGIERKIAHPALAKNAPHRAGFHAPASIPDLDQPAALRAVVQNLSDRIPRAAGLIEADQFGGRGLHRGRHIF